MTEHTPTTTPYGVVVATDVLVEDYMVHYAEQHHEWIEGTVIKMAPSTRKHVFIRQYVEYTLQTYLSLRPIGQVLGEPFVLRLDTPEKRTRREPDLMMILNENPHELTETYMNGPADICIEIVSEESSDRDHGEKFSEYERAGVREYWIVDPLRQQCRFNRINENGTYDLIYPIDDIYISPLLPDLKLTVSTLWQTPLPRLTEVVTAVQAMLKN